MPDITDGMNELEFLASKAAAGKLIIVTNSISSTGTVTSYTPASGATFILYKAKTFTSSIPAQGTTDFATVNLKNDTTVVDTIVTVAVSASGGAVGALTQTGGEFIIKGDQLIGNGSKKYEINISANAASITVYGTIIGYLL